MAALPRIHSKTRVLVAVFTLTTLITMATGDIFSSSVKVERLVQQEETILDQLKKYIDLQFDHLRKMTSFYTDKVKELNLSQRSKTLEDLQHPNAVYKAIKRFASDYATALGANMESFRRSMDTLRPRVPFEVEQEDRKGATLSLLRLQNVYHLRAADMAAGDYLGYMGPELSADDTYELGQEAFTGAHLAVSREWLKLTLNLLDQRNSTITATNTTTATTTTTTSTRTVSTSGSTLTPGMVKALLGRVNIYDFKDELARTLYEEANVTDPKSPDLIMLGKELTTMPRAEPPFVQDYFQNFSRLCRLENRHHVPKPLSPSMVCRYRHALLPYYRFKEEILARQPFASVIYNLTSDSEAELLKDHVKYRLFRAEVGDNEHHSISDTRTGDLSWIWDTESPKVAELSRRIKHLTGLETQQSQKPFSSEAFQVVNYGLGGHYEVHMDPFDSEDEKSAMNGSGKRVATLLIYLTDVTRGGSTVFTNADVAVAPIKNMALFWYNFRPDYHVDDLTHHAGCPVVIGQKWIANKWIWTAGNIFRRRCGLSPHATQLDIEGDMQDGYQQRPG